MGVRRIDHAGQGDDVRSHWEPILRDAGQLHLLERWDALDEGGRARLAERLKSLDWSQIGSLAELARGEVPVDESTVERIRRAGPPRHLVRLAELADPPVRAKAREAGLELLRDGRVAAIVVAGGQGTRLGFDRPKGLFPIAPVTNRCLFDLFAEQLHAWKARTGRSIPWLVMTSSATHAETVAAFEEANWYGLDRNEVRFFEQGGLPAFDKRTGKILLSAPDDLGLSPDGHGGLIAALQRAGLLKELAGRGIDTLYYHQVDNPLAILCDPVFLGLHELRRADVSTKVVSKLTPAEKVGVIADLDGRTEIVEYSDLPRELAEARDDAGGLRLWAGNTAMHVFRREFLERLAGGAESGDELPFHRAVKKVPYWDPAAGEVRPETENAVKFERFIFDTLPKARVALVVETDRAEEFGPLKNASGEFSPDHVRECLTARARSWLASAGIPAPAEGPVEVSAAAGLDREDFCSGVTSPRVEPSGSGSRVVSGNRST